MTTELSRMTTEESGMTTEESGMTTPICHPRFHALVSGIKLGRGG